MAILFKKITRPVDLTDKDSAKKTYPQITYQYSTPSTLEEIAQELGQTSGVSEGEAFSVLKDFRTLLKKKLIDGRTVNISGLGYFFLAAQSKGYGREFYSCRHYRATYLLPRQQGYSIEYGNNHTHQRIEPERCRPDK